ncbi:uncharacterized protein KGF55_004079 [Candida pseudojiufengensis]|uniref:uncharacterized protein n=1 Tax=Candida pseudojiufengensis TaxID=497109 RepID=UPI0022251870|nr:uncharacterized protein KGF55_004079 [Candida pseudojiufengensis]KAI5961456.1 hypothetical protein KGF55_004079 [Candida pseudojiufengensis]
MSLVQGYSSSEEEPNDQLKELQPPAKKQKTITYDNDTFEAQYKLQEQQKIKEAKAKAKELKLRRKHKGGTPWASISSDDEQVYQPNEQTNEETAIEEEEEETFKPSSKFVGASECDYQGRSYMYIPNELKKMEPQPCFVPKQIIHTFNNAHPKGVNKLEFFPKYGHLLLSCGNDGSIKLWSVDKTYELLRIFNGHKLAVKDVTFNSSGDKFLSCGYDRVIRLWKTENGEVLRSISTSAVPNVVRFNPENDSEFIVGLSNHKIEHYDLNALHNPIQVYDHHLGSINDLLVLDNGFASTSDDKSVRVWKWQINIPIKVISDPTQFSTPSIKKHPNTNYIALQSMDNTVKAVHSTGKFHWNKNKIYRGHQCAGYGIEIEITHDGKTIMSGDAKGYAFFWDWQSKKIIKKLKLNNSLIKCIRFHPLESSKVAIAGVSGDIHICD